MRQIRFPKIKRPQLRRPQLKGAPEIKPPEFLSNVYRDLRDRHLLLPALALVVALVAVPILLKSDTDAAVPAPAVAATGGHSSELTAAVLADDSVAVRDYRKRLAKLKSKNPFEPVFALPPKKDPSESTSTGGTTDTSSTSTSTSTSTSAGAVSTGGGESTATETTQTTDTTETTTETTTDNNGNDGHDGQNQPSDQDVDVVEHLVTRRVDLTIGLQGDPKLRENVKPMTILPDAATPVVAYLGTDESGKRAAFVVAKDATMVAGSGACVPAPENCLYITLEKNETATLSFGPDGQTYDLRLLAIRDVELKSE